MWVLRQLFVESVVCLLVDVCACVVSSVVDCCLSTTWVFLMIATPFRSSKNIVSNMAPRLYHKHSTQRSVNQSRCSTKCSPNMSLWCGIVMLSTCSFFLALQYSARVNFGFLCGDVSNFCQHPRKTLGHATNQNCEPILRTVLIHMLFDRICVVSDVTSYTGHKQTLKVSLSQFLLLESRARNVSS